MTMKVRVIAKHEKGLNANDENKIITHYVPQYYEEDNGWRLCHLDNRLSTRYYYKFTQAKNICIEYAKRNCPDIMWSASVDGKGKLYGSVYKDTAIRQLEHKELEEEMTRE